ncbi:MAG: RnfABCDGE type electron transport complex subunit D [Rikenellaceae bacterium]|nr:RnfABCDGE type electron transport complex subunit D [Rikenellaceae bacterium]
MEKKLIVGPSPHVHGSDTTQKLMRDVLIALAPALLVVTFIYGTRVLVVTGVSIAACVLIEFLIQRFMFGGKSTIGDLSAIVTGVLLAFNLPVSIPIWMVVLGALVAIGVGKMTFGGLGRNPFNPALVGRVFLLLSFPAAMTTFPAPSAAADAMSGATPLTYVKEAMKGGDIKLSDLMPEISYDNLLFGLHGGSLGEIAALALLLGFGYMLIRRVVTWHIPVAVLGSMALFSAILWWSDPETYVDPAFHLLTGGAILGAVFMATDYATSPMSKKGMVAYGIGIGIITILIRTWGAYPEGISFAILIMNATVPLINKYMRPRRFGVPAKI